MNNSGDRNIRLKGRIKWALVVYDLIIYAFVCLLMFVLYRNETGLTVTETLIQILMAGIPVFVFRFIWDVYSQIWRYGGIQSYIRLIMADILAGLVYFVLRFIVPVPKIIFPRYVSLFCTNLLLALMIRMIYRYAYKCADTDTVPGRILYFIFKIFAGKGVRPIRTESAQKIRTAIVGAGTTGINLADELLNNPGSIYMPVCFIDKDEGKIGRQIHGLPVLMETDAVGEYINAFDIQEAVLALPDVDNEQKRRLYDLYSNAGCQVKVYDYPLINSVENKRQLRDFDIEELLFRRPVRMDDSELKAFYEGKVILITGAGGSIGSEMGRQLARYSPERIILLDIYENGVYDLQQELRMSYKDLKIDIEIVSVCNEEGIDKIFDRYRPQVVLHAAAHKHVPLMEKNCIEAIENNIFGTLNVVRSAYRHKAERFIMISTDKAVNPTSIMGATKRVCEMIVQAYGAVSTGTVFSSTRFGNVLGSSGSVIPLFKRQIMHGGPVTVTDKEIIRYFMTIPEACALVLHSGVLANNGELFVLDMGEPVKIMSLAETMIRLYGMVPGVDIKIVETGLRPGEKLYEELLVKDGKLGKTKNDLIFTEFDKPLSMEEIEEKLKALKDAVDTGSEETAREALIKEVPTFIRKD
ncbi:MAG: polysaccharide biosynthesis protein [Christensenellaceae bacterium]|nr:polysaccharide biosynthesis protein [Christensenellaceae bacterium]